MRSPDRGSGSRACALGWSATPRSARANDLVSDREGRDERVVGRLREWTIDGRDRDWLAPDELGPIEGVVGHVRHLEPLDQVLGRRGEVREDQGAGVDLEARRLR